jgi:hypothetical protein
VVSAARALLALEVGLYLGAKRASNALAQLEGGLSERFPTFDRFLSAVPSHLPVGQTRLTCTPSYLAESDAVLAALEARFRAELLTECLSVLSEFKQDEA